MKKLIQLALTVLFVLGPVAVSTKALGANVNFVGTVGPIEVRTAAWGSGLVIQILGSGGTPMTLCAGVTYNYAMGLPLTDASTKSIQANLLYAKQNGLTVTGWGLDASVTGGTFCGMGNLAF